MCPSIAVLAGGGDGGGGSGKGAGDGSGDNNAGAGSGGENAESDGRGAPDYQRYPECGYASHPVDVVTGRAFTHPVADLTLPGPLPLSFSRMYSTKAAHIDMGLGYGWAHTFGWKVEVRRRSIVVWNEQGIAVDFPLLRQGDEVIGPWGWVLRREPWGFALDADDGLWHLFSEEDPHQKGFHLLTAVEDRNRNRIALTYDDGRLVEVKDSAGRIIKLVPDRERRIASIQVQNAISQGQWIAFATYAYDQRGNLASVTDADGHVAHFEYDEDHRLTRDQDRAGLTFHFVYDTQGRCIESWGDYPGKRDPSLADGLPKYLHDDKTRAKGVHHCKFEYGAGGYTEVVDSTQVRRFFGNRHGTLDKAVEGGGVMTAVYRDDGHILSRTDPMGGKTQWDRDARGRVLKVTDPLGRTTVTTRDAAGLPIEMVDAKGGVTSFTRDAQGNVLVEVTPIGGTYSYRYDDRGLRTEAIAPTGAKTAYAYDAQGNLVTLTGPNGASVRFTYDALGNLLSVTDPTGGETRYAYSRRGDLIEVRDAAGSVVRHTYDGERRPTQIVDGKNHLTQFVYGGFQKLCDRIDANGNVVRLRYNLEGELLEVHNERGETHRFEYDACGRFVGETTFDGRTLRYRNDAIGRAVRIKNGAGEVMQLEYDLAGQLVKRELADGSVEEFVYDALGEMVSARSPTAEIDFERDALGRVVREVQRYRDTEQWTEVSYDLLGRRVGRRTSLGHSETVTRGPLGERVHSVLDGTHEVRHRVDQLGREIARALPRGGWLQSSYDGVDRITRRRAGTAKASWSRPDLDGAASGPKPRPAFGRPGEPEWIGEQDAGISAEISFRYDGAGEMVGAWDRARGGTEYTYDPIGQLLARVPEKARPELFAYDAAGNVTERGEGGAARVYGKGNSLQRRGDTEYVWDAEGRLTEKRRANEVWRYAWDGVGLLRAVERPDGVRVDFSYDPLARRVAKKVTKRAPSGAGRALVSETRFVWDGDVLVHEIKTRAIANGDPVVEQRTYWFEDEGFAPAAHRDAAPSGDGGWVHYLNDHAGAPEKLIDEAGEVALELDRKAWGETAPTEGAAGTPIRFQGQYEDEETGLSYNRYRYYDPVAARYISPDPLKLAGGLQSHGYGLNPVSDVDPLGLRARNAQQELRSIPTQGRSQADIAADLQARGYRQCPGNGGGTVWTKPMPKGQTASVRLDPATRRNPPLNRADEVPHAHKEIVPTAAVNRRGNYEPDRVSARLNEQGNVITNPESEAGRRAAHIPTQ